jgi:tRNA-splicing ligase RtcB
MNNIFGTHDEKTLAQLTDVASRAAYVALMADGHMGYVMPIGGVAAYRNKVSVTGVGFDIACGNCAIKTNLNVKDFEQDGMEWIATVIQHSISFGLGRTNDTRDAPTDHSLFDSPVWGLLPSGQASLSLKAKAREQLGTVGSGNHYVDVFYDENGTIWVGVHFGSRGFGHTVASGFLALGTGNEWGTKVKEQEVLLDLDTYLGQDYWNLMNLCGQYAYAGREWVARKVVGILGGIEVEMVHNHHNFAWKEQHFGEDLIVVRKGATPAFPGQKGFVGGSMGDNSVILQGSGSVWVGDPKIPIQEAALYSTVHGAGRVMSRTQARGKTKGWGAKAKIVSPGLVSWDMVNKWLGPKHIILRGGGLDEAPQAYRRLPEVLTAQGSTITVLHTLTPLIVVMAGENEYDPYKD